MVGPHVPSGRHLAANLLDVTMVERSCRRRKDLLVLDPDVLLIQRFEARQTVSKLRKIGLRETIVRKPLTNQFIDGRVVRFGFVVIVFEPVQ